jgi:hypothetical protein
MLGISITPNLDIFGWLFGSTTFMGVHWLLPLMTTVIVMAIVTVELQKWKIMLLPTLASFGSMGIEMSPVIYIIASILFVNETFHVEVIGNVIRGINNSVRKPNALTKLASERANRSIEGEKGLSKLIRKATSKIDVERERIKEKKPKRFSKFNQERIDTQKELLKLKRDELVGMYEHESSFPKKIKKYKE